tara:strand:+ start:383 stop:937 length:555 start_codon:yes stop_codon:yes gene_type:complete
MSIKLTSDQTATAVVALKAYNKASNTMAKASALQGTSGVDYITAVSPAIISIYKELSQDGALIGKRTNEASDMTTAIFELLATTGLKANHSLAKRTISLCSSWYLTSIKLGADVTPLATILDNAEDIKSAAKSVSDMDPKKTSPQDMVQSFVARFCKAHPNEDLLTLVANSVEKVGNKALIKAA